MTVSNQIDGAEASGASADDEQALAVPVEPASGLAPSGFDPSRVAAAIRGLTKTQPKALLALPPRGTWATASELKHRTTAASLDVLYIMRTRAGEALCDRRWTKWGSERGQRRGEGYEYAITPFGGAVRRALLEAEVEAQ